MKVAIDAMGGDFAPQENVLGAIEALQEYKNKNLEIILVGDRDKILEFLPANYADTLNLTIHHTTEIIEMNDHPAAAVREKKDSSLVVAARLVKEGSCDAFVSAGSTGAAVTASLLILGKIKIALRKLSGQVKRSGFKRHQAVLIMLAQKRFAVKMTLIFGFLGLVKDIMFSARSQFFHMDKFINPCCGFTPTFTAALRSRLRERDLKKIGVSFMDNPKAIILSFTLFNRTINFLRRIDEDVFNDDLRDEYVDLLSAFIEKKNAVRNRLNYGAIFEARTDAERETALSGNRQMKNNPVNF
jgi:hypothetical protein